MQLVMFFTVFISMLNLKKTTHYNDDYGGPLHTTVR